MKTAQRNQLFTDETTSTNIALTAFIVRYDALHLGAARQTTIGVATLTGVQQRAHVALDGALASLLRDGMIVPAPVKARPLHLSLFKTGNERIICYQPNRSYLSDIITSKT